MPRITEHLVRRAKARRHRYEMTCSVFRGFILRVLPSGKKVFYVRVRREGRYCRVRIGGADVLSVADAQTRARHILSQSPVELDPLAHQAGQGRAPRVRAFAVRYLADHVDQHLKPSTRKKYRDHIKRLVRAFGSRRLDRISRDLVERWHGSLGATPSAANSALRVLSHMFTKAQDWSLIASDHKNPTRGVRAHREHRRERFLSPDERRRLEQVLCEGEVLAARRAGAISWATAGAIRLLALTGMRRSEVLGLQWPMVDLRRLCVCLPDSKTGPRIVPIGSPAVELLRGLARRRGGSSHVFHSGAGHPLNAQAFGRSWRGIRIRAGIPDVRIHDLRHSAASDALMAGIPLAVVGRILGHKKPGTTARYAHISDTVLTDAVELMAITIASRSRTGRSGGAESPEGEGAR